MKTEIEHTPTPYSISGITGDAYIMAKVNGERQNVAIVVGWPGRSPEEFDATKRFIVQACNNHDRLSDERDRLVEALRSISLDLEQLDQQSDLRPAHQSTLTGLREQARAALAELERGAGE